MKRYIDGLGDVMKDQKRFYSLPKEIQKAVYSYLNLHRKKRKLEKKKKELIDNFNKEKKELENEIKSVTRDETNNFKIIKDLPKDYQLVNIYVETDRNSYRLDIHFCGFRKKCSLGTDLNKIQKACEGFIPKLNKKISKSNFKEVITSSMVGDLNDFIVDNGFNKFRDSKKIILDYSTNKFEYISEIKVDIVKEDKVKKSQRIVWNSKTKNPSIGRSQSINSKSSRTPEY
jgi:hypothetical protein